MRGSSCAYIAARIARPGEGFHEGCGTGSRWLFQNASVRWIVRRLASLSAKASKACGRSVASSKVHGAPLAKTRVHSAVMPSRTHATSLSAVTASTGRSRRSSGASGRP